MSLGWSATWTIAKREVTCQFFSPVAYIVWGVFALIASLLFIRGYDPGQPIGLIMRSEFKAIVWLLVFITPGISMRLVSEELRSGTVELLMTAPLSDTQIVVGKWLGAVLFFLTLLIPLVLQVLLLEITGKPDYGPIVTGLVGIVLVGAMYLAIGIFISALSDSQLIAFFLTVLVTGFLTIGMYLISQIPTLPAWATISMGYVNVDQQFDAFAKGLIDVRNFVYFISVSALFLFLGVKLLESRRWR